MKKIRELKAALITGSSRGIGYELAKLAADDGYNPVLVSRSKSKLKDVKEELEEKYQVEGMIIPGDLSYPDTPEQISKRIEETNFRIDLLINNAGRGQMGDFLETSWETDEEMMHLNMDAVIHLTKIFLPKMVKRGEGRILNVSSLAAFQPGPMMALYYATKSFVLNFSEALAEEFHRKGITVTALCPGPVNTDFQIKGSAPQEKEGKNFYSMDSKTVAKAGYDGLQNGKRVVVPGGLMSISPQLVRFFPRKAVTKIVRKINEYRLN